MRWLQSLSGIFALLASQAFALDSQDFRVLSEDWNRDKHGHTERIIRRDSIFGPVHFHFDWDETRRPEANLEIWESNDEKYAFRSSDIRYRLDFVSGSTRKDIVVVTNTQGAYCCNQTTIFHTLPHLKKIYQSDETMYSCEIKDLVGGGPMEIVTSDNAFNNMGPHGQPAPLVALKFNGSTWLLDLDLTAKVAIHQDPTVEGEYLWLDDWTGVPDIDEQSNSPERRLRNREKAVGSGVVDLIYEGEAAHAALLLRRSLAAFDEPPLRPRALVFGDYLIGLARGGRYGSDLKPVLDAFESELYR